MTSCKLYNADCLEQMKKLKKDSIDLIFCDLPYGQTSCKWDTKIDLNLFWKQIMRIKKLNTPIFMTTTTKFGVDLITSAPKKCFFRYDLVWVKSSPAGFLLAKKMPMRKHEMIYVFYEKLPFYNLSSHRHKFIDHKEGQIKPPTESDNSPYGGEASRKKQLKLCVGGKVGKYEPKLPVSVIKDTKLGTNTYNTEKRNKPLIRNEGGQYSPKLPVSVLSEPKKLMYDNGTYTQKDNADKGYRKLGKKSGESAWEPSLPVSCIKETKNDNYGCERIFYTDENGDIIKEGQSGKDQTKYDPPLPNSILEIKSTKGKHSTEKPVALMSWILKYYSNEGDTVLDPTMGSGSTGISCKEMNRNFIGIEMNDEIFEVAKKRLE